MFETLVTGLLTGALGSYIDPKCFSSDKINVEVWSGYVVLHALELKPDVIAHPALNLVRGMVGSIELKIPWNRLHSDSVVVTIDDVYLLVRTEEDIERAVLEMNEFTIKKQLLEELYAQAKQQQDAAEQAANASASADSGFAARLVNKIIDNLELHIRRIHVRLEDYSTGDHPFSVGLTIESVHIQSTNSSWQPSYIDTSKSSEPRIYKIVELNHLSVYLNPHCDVLRHQHADFAHCSLDEFSSFFSRSIPKRFDDRHYQHTQLYPSHQQHHFVLKPIDAHARLVVNRDPFDTSGPKFDLAVSIPEVALRLEDSQYCDLLYLASAFQVPSHVAKYQQYKRLRPRRGVLDAAPREWWQYAITAVLQDVRVKRQRWSWSYMKQRREDRKRYVAAWERHSRQFVDGHERSYLDSESEEDGDEAQDKSVFSESNDEGDDDEKASLFSSGSGSHASSSRGSSKSGGANVTGSTSVLEEIESRRSVEDILFFRYLADRRVREYASAKSAEPLPPPPRSMPMPASAVFSDTESVDTELSESTLPTEVKFRSWGSWMFGWTSKLTAPSASGLPDEAPRRVLPEVELRELFKILEYEPSKRSKQQRAKVKKRMQSGGLGGDGDNDGSDDHELDDDYAQQSDEFRVTVTLGKGSLTLASDTDANKKLQRDDPSYSSKYAPTDFLLGTFSHLQLAAVARNDAIKVDVSLQSIEAFDESSESSSFSRLLSRKQSSVLGGGGGGTGVGGGTGELENPAFSGPVFLLSYETHPANSSADAALYIHLEPLEIVFSPTATCWGRLSGFLNTPSVLGLWAELEVASFNDIVNLKARTEAKLKYAMANRIAVSVDLRIQAPVIIIPESDTDINCARLVVDLGHINFRTDRLSKLDGDSLLSMSSSASAPLSGLGGSSLALLQPLSSPSLTSSTSFVKQLYDDAEKGEGAIRWKEEFYDKFSLSVTNIHVFLVPYGRNRAATTSDRAAVAGASLPPRGGSGGMNTDEHEFELVERFTINVTVRMSVLPLDATLTRFYVHADLPALTFKMSLEKYFQLAYLVERFSVASAAAAAASSAADASPFESSLFDSTDLFDSLDVNGFDSDDRFLARRKSSFLSASMLKRIMDDDVDGDGTKTISSSTELVHVDSEDSDSESSTGSDDTWFSITSGTVDLNLLPPLESAEFGTGGTGSTSSGGGGESSAHEPFHAESFARSDRSTTGLQYPVPPQAQRRARRADRAYTASAPQSELLDRRLMVCTFTFPLISVQLKKPASMGVPASASYRYDGSDFEEDIADNGTVLVKLQGFRVRLAKKTLSTQANCSFRSLEVEDYLDASGKASEFLLFSCPTISAPFSMRAPQRRSGKAFPTSVLPRRRASRQRERVISFQRHDVGAAATAPAMAHAPAPAPENLLDFVYSLVNDSVTGHEAVREVDIRVGCLQINFDQSYICSLLELLDETSSRLALAPIPASDFALTATLPTDIDSFVPPLQLTPSVSQEYSLPMSLTESVRADLESARKRLLASQTSAAAKAKSDESARAPKPALLKLTVRSQSLSVCFCDRGEPEASVAILRVQVQLNTIESGDVVVKGTVSDIKVFDLCPKKHAGSDMDNDAQLGGVATKRDAAGGVRREFTDIFGLDTSAQTSKIGAASQFIVGIDCRIVLQQPPQQHASDEASAPPPLQPRKSSVSVAVQPIQLVVQPDFVESVTSYVMDGPLRAYLLTRHDPPLASRSRHDAFARPPRSQSFGFDDIFARHPRSQSFVLETSSLHSTHSPFLDAASFASPRHHHARLTPFFDAVDLSSKRLERSSPKLSTQRADNAVGTTATVDSPHDGEDDAVIDKTVPSRSVFDMVDIDLKLVSTSIVLPSMTIEGASSLSGSSGLRIHFGSVAGSIVNVPTEDAGRSGGDRGDDGDVVVASSGAKEIHLAVSGVEIKFIHEDVNLLEKMELRVRCDIPALLRTSDTGTTGTASGGDDAADDTTGGRVSQRPRLDVHVDVSAVCINVGEKTACLGLDVFYGTIKPILDIAKVASQRRDRFDADSVLGSVVTKEDLAGDDMLLSRDDDDERGGASTPSLGVKVSVSVEAITIALQTHSEAPQLFEVWLKSVFDAGDEGHARDVAGMLGQNALSSPRRQRPDAWGRRSSLPRAPGATVVAEIVATGLTAKLTTDSLDLSAESSRARYKLSLQKAVIRDKIADPEECITDLLESVSRVRAPRAHRDDRATRRSLAATSRHSSSFGLDLDEHAPLLTESFVDDAREPPQLSVVVEAQPTPRDGARQSDNMMTVTLTSARVNVLPRTLLRLEHFGVETFLTVRRRVYQLEAQYKPRMLAPAASSARNHTYMDGLRDFGESRGDDHAMTVQRSHTLPDRWIDTARPSRKNSMSGDSVRDGGDGKKLAFLSPMTQSLRLDDDRYGKLSTSDLATSTQVAVAETDEDESVRDSGERPDAHALIDSSSTSGGGEGGANDSRSNASSSDKAPKYAAWVVHVELSNLQLWLLSTDKKVEAAGVKLCASVAADVETYHSNVDADADANADASARTPSRQDRVVASAQLCGIELSICSPVDERVDSDSRGAKSVHFPWTLVEPFSVHVALRSLACHRLEPELSSIGGAALMRAVSFGKMSSSLDDGGDKLLQFDSSDASTVLKRLPVHWSDWVQHEASVKVEQIASCISYRNLPVLLKIASSLASVAGAEEKVRQTLAARLKALEDELGWDFGDNDDDDDDHHHYHQGESGAYASLSERDDGTGSVVSDKLHLTAAQRAITHATLEMDGVQFRVINNIVDQESPVIGLNVAHVRAAHFANARTGELELSVATAIDAWYHNLRLVTSEPLIEPWHVDLLVSKQPHTRNTVASGGSESDAVAIAAIDSGHHHTLEAMPLEVKVVSSATLQVNLTEAFVANLMAANRAWQWVVNEGGDPREMTEYSTYWIRNNTGLHLHYWGRACKASTLAPGGEEPLEFIDSDAGSDEPFVFDHASAGALNGEFEHSSRTNGSSSGGDERTYQANNRQIFVAVFEDATDDANGDVNNASERKWQSETAIPVDQVDSRMYALVRADADASASKLRKCECVIDVLVERGCKVFVVRSTLLLENKSGSDLEVEFLPPPAEYVSPESRGHDAAPMWRSVVRASSVVPVPLHLVSLGEGHLVTRPPEIRALDASGKALPKPYAKERVRLPLFDRDATSASGSDELNDASSTMKFHRLVSDRPVRPFILRACLSNSSSGLYHRTLSFHPPLVIHNLTAGPLEFCLATPNDWVPAADTPPRAGRRRWEDAQQRLRERGTINVADRVVWHVSDWDTPLELTVRMKGFEWSEPLVLGRDVVELARIKMKDVVTDSFLYITAETELGASKCRELFLYVPYWIVNLTGLKLEYEFDDERTGSEHLTTLLAGQKRLDRDELLLKENQRAKLARRERNAHLLHAPFAGASGSASDRFDTGAGTSASDESERREPEHERKRRHPCLLPSVPPIKGLLDLLPKSIDDPKAFGQLEVLQVCHSDHRAERGCVRLRVTDDELAGGLESAKDSSAQQRKWSDVLVLDQTGTSGELETADYGTSRNYSIGYSISAAAGRYSRTKVVMLTPRFMLVNTLACAIEVCHSSAKFSTTTASAAIDIASSVHLPNNGMMSSMNSVVHLDAGAYADFHWTLRFGKTRAIRCRLAEYGWSWSGAVPLSESGEYAVRMRHESTRESKLLRLTLKLDGSCVCVSFREESASAPPYRVENYSLETLRIHQLRVRRSEILLPHHSLDYAWDEPTQERMLVVDMLPSAAGDNSRPLRIGTFALDKIQRYPDALSGTLGIEVSTDGPTRVLRFTDARLRGDRGSELLASETAASSAAAAGTGRKEPVLGYDFLRRFVSAPSLHVIMQLQGIGVSVVDGVPKELVYASVSGIHLQMLVSDDDRKRSSSAFMSGRDAVSRLERESSPRILACRFEIGDVQIDNQLQSTPFPVLLRFSNSAARAARLESSDAGTAPALQIDLVKHDEYAGINFIRYFSARALPVHMRVDGSLLSHLAPLVLHSNAYGALEHLGKSKSGGSGNGASQRSPHSLLLDDFNASLTVNVRILAAIREDEATTSVAPSSLSMRTNRSRTEGVTGGGAHVGAHGGDGEYAPYAASIPLYPTQGKFTTKDEDKKLYFEEFYIDPIRATVSFSFGSGVGAIADSPYGALSSLASSRESSSASSAIPVGPLRLILNAIGTSLTKIANAPFKLKAVEISHSFMQPDALATRLTSHYQSEALRQAYVILGSVDVLGNPMIAWKNLKAGFQDFIYEPAYGMAKSPTDFAFGVGRGTLSLLRASVYTFLDFNARILTAGSLGLSEACLKLDDYTGYPATRNIYQGFAQGISGIVVAPIHAVEVNGVRGVVPGLFAGVFGLVLKPLLGFSLAAATTTASLRDAVDPNTKALLMRVRPPRFIDLRTRRLKVYSYVESRGEEIVGKLRGGRFRADGYLGHVDLKKKCLLVTRKRILLLDVRSGSGGSAALKYDVEWELLAEEVILVESRGHSGDDAVTLYYIREDFNQRHREPVALHGMLLSKYVVTLPASKLLFLRAMLQQMERSVITKMNCGASSSSGNAGPATGGGTENHWTGAIAAPPIDRSPWPSPHQNQQRNGSEYPIFRFPPALLATRSFVNSVTQHQHQQ